MMKFNIICASHNEDILNKNLGASTFFQANYKRNHIIRGYKNVAAAYNIANEICFGKDEYNLFIHHDVFLPPTFETDLKKAINLVNSFDDGWGVLGVAGAILEDGKRKYPGYVRDRGHDWGSPAGLPQEVQTLDELLLVTKGYLQFEEFDEQFDLHFYGADVCMQAIKLGRKNYAINAYVHHNSGLKPGHRSDSFKECEVKFKNKWKDFLPILTTCTLLQ